MSRTRPIQFGIRDSIPRAILVGLREILSRIPYTPLALRRQGQKLVASGNVAKANELARRLAKIDPRRATHLRGAILAQSQPHTDHTEFWSSAAARFPSEMDFVRKTVHAALKAGKVEVAEAGLQTLIERRRTRWKDSNFVVGLANVYAAQSDPSRIRKLIRQFLRSLRRTPDYRIAAVRLSKLIFAHFPRSHLDLAKAPGIRP